jgi:hypothetical protein
MLLYKRFGLTVLAVLVLLSSTGVNIFEHICNSEHLKVLSLVKVACKDDIGVNGCCKINSSKSSRKPSKKKACCENKLFFVKSEIQNYYPNLLEKKTKDTDKKAKNADCVEERFSFPEYIRYSQVFPPRAYHHPPILDTYSIEFLCIMRC